jgi:hypothetical protein
MATDAYVAASSAGEVARAETGRRAFLNQSIDAEAIKILAVIHAGRT